MKPFYLSCFAVVLSASLSSTPLSTVSAKTVSTRIVSVSSGTVMRLRLLKLKSSSGLISQVSPSAAPPTTEQKIAYRRKTLHTMKVQSAQFGAAQTTFEKALKKWYTFGGTIKRIAPESYTAISPEFDQVKKGLYQSSVPIATLQKSLQALIRDVGEAVPISDAQE
jgi:hypothetical protein